MKAVFIESTEFTTWVSEYLPDEALAKLQQELMEAPEQGAVMPGCGGLRKIRIADPRRGKGKRSGARVIYLHIPEARWFYLLDVYGKDEKDDLSADDKKTLSKLVTELQQQSRAAVARSHRRKR